MWIFAGRGAESEAHNLCVCRGEVHNLCGPSQVAGAESEASLVTCVWGGGVRNLCVGRVRFITCVFVLVNCITCVDRRRSPGRRARRVSPPRIIIGP